MVELSIVLVLLVALLVGTVSVAVAFGRDNAIQNAAREGTRFGATYPGPIDTAWLQTIRDVTRSAASGDLDASEPGQYICVAYVDGTSDMRLTDTGGVEATSSAACFNDGRPADEKRVQVVAERDTGIEAIMFTIDITLSSESTARWEREE